MKRVYIKTKEDLDTLNQMSLDSPQVIFKHSTRCSISAMALNRVESGNLDIEIHVLDVISDRGLSNMVSDKFNVMHQSPQILIIYKGRSIFDTSHFEITSSTVERQLSIIEPI